ncbi:MAG: glutamine--fructose-6-phosphate transaminase (isomerizing) [Clostridia bacterium]|nr:glutamine--fructose-6-phosphate transaminase (isomerizing) [Clostridia bacterium]
MCGIMGYIGDENAVNVIIKGLEDLEYRGYDSAGIAVSNGSETTVVKTAGSPSGLWDKCKSIKANIGIGHTRWATHGAATEQNAHPHTSEHGMFSIVHNGIIENYAELKSGLDGVRFTSETDSEVIAQLLEKEYTGDLKGTVGGVVKKLKGSFALGIMCSDYPDVLVCAKKSSPLFVGVSPECTYLASDISAVADKSMRIFRLNDNEIGMLTKDSFKVYDTDGCRIRKSEVKIKSFDKSADKGGYEHFMLKEIMEQPTAVRRTLDEITADGKISFKGIKWNRDEISEINNIRFIACGSAYHAGLVGAYAAERLIGCPAEACIASEFRYMYPHLDSNTLVVIISQSGETADTLAALRLAKKKGAKTVSIVNVENSTIAAESDCVIMTRAGKEVAVATTKAYSAQLAVIYALVLYIAMAGEKISKNEFQRYVNELKKLPDKIEQILISAEVGRIPDKILAGDYVCFIGRGFDYCTAEEASLKLKEISYIPCEAYAAGELKHGTISLISDKSLVIALCCSSELKDKIMSNVNEAAARGAKIITVTDIDGDGDIKIPNTLDMFFPSLEIIPMQLIAYYTAKNKGCAIDKPKNLAKSVTVE